MPPTKRGVYYNLRESTYKLSLYGYDFYFSSRYLQNKFVEGLNDYIAETRVKIQMLLGIDIEDEPLTLSFYKQIEKRGFRVTKDGDEVWLDNLKLNGVSKTRKNLA